MLHEFLGKNRSEIIARTRSKIRARATPHPTQEELTTGVPLFLDQLGALLRRSSGGSGGIGPSAAIHGGVLQRLGLSVGQVVHDYGDICQAVTELAEEMNAPITVEEFHTLNRCLDDAIASAVTEFSRLRDSNQRNSESERRGTLAHELRNKLNVAMLAYEALKGGRVGIGGSTSAVLERNLRGLRALIDGSLAEVRIVAGISHLERFSAADLVGEITADSSFEAESHDMQFSVAPVDPELKIEADRAILGSSIINLVQNAFKYSPAQTHVSLTLVVTDANVTFEVEDGCGGLPDGGTESMFGSFVQQGDDRHGVGLGLAISRKGIEANGGEMRVRDLPGKGCIFTISVPRVPLSGLTAP